MAEDQTTLNEGVESSTPQPTPQSQGELVSTVDLMPTQPADTDPEGANNTGADAVENAAESVKADAGKPDEGLITRFDKHPRFVELNTRVKTAEESNRQLLDRIAKLEAQRSSGPDAGDNGTPLPFKDIAQMTDDELLDWQSSDPKGYYENLAKYNAHVTRTEFQQILAERDEQARQQAFESQIDRTYSAYANDNPDFDQMWDSGEITAYIDTHPGHNPISAHMALTAEARMQAKVDEAVKAALDKADADQRSKRATRSIMGAGPSRQPTPPSDAELKDPKKYGGDTQVLTERLLARRRAAGM